MIERVSSPYEEALDNLPVGGSIIERMPYRELRFFVEAAALSVSLFLPSLFAFAIIFWMVTRPASIYDTWALAGRPFLLWLVVVVGAVLVTTCVRWARWKYRKRKSWVSSYLRHAGLVLLKWKPFLMTYRLDAPYEEISVVAESDGRMRKPGTAAIYIASIALFGGFFYWFLMADFNGAIVVHIVRTFLLIALIGLVLAPRIHWTSAFLAIPTAWLWLSLAWEATWPWYVYTMDVSAGCLILSLVLCAYSDWYYGHTYRFLSVVEGSLSLVSPKMEFFGPERMNSLQEARVNTEEPLQWAEDYEGYVLQLPVKQDDDKAVIPFRLGTEKELQFLEEKGMQLSGEIAPEFGGISSSVDERWTTALCSVACILVLVLLPFELQLYHGAVASQLAQFESGKTETLYATTKHAIELQPISAYLHYWRMVSASECGRHSEVLAAYKTSLEYSRGKGRVGKKLGEFKQNSSLRFSRRATRIQGDHSVKAKAYLANYKELCPAFPRAESLFKQARAILEKDIDNAQSRLALIRLAGLIDHRRYLLHSTILNETTRERLDYVLRLINKENEAERSLLARVYFNYEQFAEADKLLEKLHEPSDKLLRASVGRYLGKSEKELLSLVEPISKHETLGHSARLLKALILVQFGKVTEGRKLLLEHKGEDIAILSALVCSQQASRVLDNALRHCYHNSQFFGSHTCLPVSILAPDCRVFAELANYEWMSTVDIEHLIHLQQKRDFCRLASLDWYPYSKQAGILAQTAKAD